MKNKFYALLSVLVIGGGCLFGGVNSTREVLRDLSLEREEVIASYDSLISKWERYSSTVEWDFEKLLNAVEFSAVKHAGQVRKDLEATPYIIHPIGVAHLLWDLGEVRSENILIAALLHDTLEDTDTDEVEIETLFGQDVLRIVKEVTNDPSLSSQENKQRQVEKAPSMSHEAKLVKLADRLYNVRDLTPPPPSWSQEKIDNYREWGAKLLEALKGTNSNLEEALRAEVT